jgi:hypothetical protein
MSSFYLALLPVVAAALVGCASTPAPKPYLSSADLLNVAEMDYFSEQCSRHGKMALETAALGKTLVSWAMQRYTIDMYKFGQFKTNLASENMRIDQRCNEVSLQILTIKGKQDAVKSTNASAPSFMPRTTNCSTYFGQTHCTSY